MRKANIERWVKATEDWGGIKSDYIRIGIQFEIFEEIRKAYQNSVQYINKTYEIEGYTVSIESRIEKISGEKVEKRRKVLIDKVDALGYDSARKELIKLSEDFLTRIKRYDSIFTNHPRPLLKEL